MHKNVKTVKNYIGKTKTGPIPTGVGYTIKEGWINSNNASNKRKAGFQTEKEILDEIKNRKNNESN